MHVNDTNDNNSISVDMARAEPSHIMLLCTAWSTKPQDLTRPVNLRTEIYRVCKAQPQFSPALRESSK